MLRSKRQKRLCMNHLLLILLAECIRQSRGWVVLHPSGSGVHSSLQLRHRSDPSPAPTTSRIRTYFQACPILDYTESSNAATAATLEKPQARAAVPPKRLGRASEIGFLIASLRGKPHKYLARLQKKHGENFIIHPNIVVLNDPKAIRDVLETHNLPKTPKVRFGYKSIFYGTRARSSGGILAAPWTKWLEQRRMAAPALAESVIGSLAPKFYEVSLPFFAYLDIVSSANKAVDMSSAFTAVTMDVIGKILLGKSFGMCNRLHLEGESYEVPFATALHTLTGKQPLFSVSP